MKDTMYLQFLTLIRTLILVSWSTVNLSFFSMVCCNCQFQTGNLFNMTFFVCGTSPTSTQAIRVFFMLRSLSLQLQGEPETQLPLTRPEDLIKTDDVLDLSKSHTEEHGRTVSHDTISSKSDRGWAIIFTLRGYQKQVTQQIWIVQ